MVDGGCCVWDGRARRAVGRRVQQCRGAVMCSGGVRWWVWVGGWDGLCAGCLVGGLCRSVGFAGGCRPGATGQGGRGGLEGRQLRAVDRSARLCTTYYYLCGDTPPRCDSDTLARTANENEGPGPGREVTSFGSAAQSTAARSGYLARRRRVCMQAGKQAGVGSGPSQCACMQHAGFHALHAAPPRPAPPRLGPPARQACPDVLCPGGPGPGRQGPSHSKLNTKAPMGWDALLDRASQPASEPASQKLQTDSPAIC